MKDSLLSKQKFSVMDSASMFLVLGTSCMQLILGVRFSYILDSNAADERLLLETHVQHTGICNINMSGILY